MALLVICLGLTSWFLFQINFLNTDQMWRWGIFTFLFSSFALVAYKNNKQEFMVFLIMTYPALWIALLASSYLLD